MHKYNDKENLPDKYYQGGPNGENEREKERDPGATTLSERDRFLLSQAISGMIAKTGNNTCVFSEDEQKGIKHHQGMLKDIGNGDAHQGIREEQKNHEHVTGVRQYSSDAKKWTWRALVTAVVSWAGWSLWAAFKKDAGGG